MSHSRRVPASTRYGQRGRYWGNLVMPAGGMKVLEKFSFEDEPGVVNVVMRILVNPLDVATKLYYYERVDRFGALEARAAGHH